MRGRGRPGGGGGEGGRLAALLPFSAWLFSPSLPGSSPHPSRLLVLGGRRGRGRPPWGNLPWGAERVGSPSPMGIHPQAIPAGGSVHGGFSPPPTPGSSPLPSLVLSGRCSERLSDQGLWGTLARRQVGSWGVPSMCGRWAGSVARARSVCRWAKGGGEATWLCGSEGGEGYRAIVWVGGGGAGSGGVDGGDGELYSGCGRV